jgi:sphingolipid delta-4 desaturase
MPSEDATWHLNRKKQVMKRHPEIRKELEGVFYPSALFVMALTGFQWFLWCMVQKYVTNYLLMLVLVFINANTALYALSTFIHENSHGLILGWGMRIPAAILIELGFTSFGEQWEYTVVHFKLHHPMLNDQATDSECPDKGHVAVPLENKFMRPLAPFIELLPFGTMITQGQLSNNAQHKSYGDRLPPMILAGVSIAVHAYLAYHGMFRAMLFAAWSACMYASRWNMALHGQSIAEHFHHNYKPTDKDAVPTHSTYHWFENFLGFNTGYHDEHHTFPNVSWYYLPALRKKVPDVFCHVNKERYWGLWYEWAINGFETDRFRICKK